VLLAKTAAKETGLAAAGDRVVIVAGVPFAKTGITNLIQVEVL